MTCPKLASKMPSSRARPGRGSPEGGVLPFLHESRHYVCSFCTGHLVRVKRRGSVALLYIAPHGH